MMETLPPNSVIAAETIPGGPLLKEPKADPCAVVIFGVTGDLSKRKLVPALYNLLADGSLPDELRSSASAAPGSPRRAARAISRIDRAVRPA